MSKTTYDFEIVRESSQSTNKLKLSKRVRVTQDHVELGVFPSINYLFRESLTELGIQLDKACISKVCNGKRAYHRGMTFQFVNKYNQIKGEM